MLEFQFGFDVAQRYSDISSLRLVEATQSGGSYTYGSQVSDTEAMDQ